MSPVVEIGLPQLDEEKVGQLAENCEQEISNYILSVVPSKSIEEMSISCVLEIADEQLNVNIDVDIIQKYDTGQDLEEIIENASEHGAKWLEGKLLELKSD
ncbi:MAG: DUF3194 domain-containing protein [Candidatus Thorarchaeota archaeon]